MLEDRGLLTAFSPDADIYENITEPVSVKNRPERTGFPEKPDLEIVFDLAPLEALWRKFEKEAICTVFQSWHWISCWHKHKSQEEKIRPIFVIGREGDNPSPLFIWPLQVRKHFGQNVLEWFGQSHSSYNMGLYRPDAFSKLQAPALLNIIKTITHTAPEIDFIQFSNQPEIWNGYKNPFCFLPFSLAPNASYSLSLEENFEDVFLKSVSSKSRGNIRRYEKKLRAAGQVEIEQAQTKQRAQDILQAYFAQKDAQFAEQGITNVFANDAVKNFYHDLCRKTEDIHSGLHCSALTLDNDIQATCIGLHFQNRYYLLMLSMTTGPLRHMAPGRILMRHDIEACCKEGYRFYDMGAGSGQHKEEWCNHSYQLIDSIFPVSLKGYALSIPVRIKRNVKRMIKNNQKLWTFARFIRKRMKGHMKNPFTE